MDLLQFILMMLNGLALFPNVKIYMCKDELPLRE